jgi:peptide/nickel transport system substrate-binding protein
MHLSPPNTAGAVDRIRRRFMPIAILALVVVSTGGLLTACSSAASPASSQAASAVASQAASAVASQAASAVASQAASGEPRRGGTLRIGCTGGGTTDTLDPQTWTLRTDQLRVQQLYDPLVWQAADGSPQLVLAKSVTPNADGTEWTITIPAGITTHSGKPFTAEDVLFSFQRIVDSKGPGLILLGPIDIKASKVVDDTTVMLKFSKPFGVLLDNLAFPYFYMVPRGFDPAKPDGTGPFKYESYTPGAESTFVRNDHYWQSGLPYLDKIVTQDIADESSQVSGLQAGQFDAVNDLSAASVAALKDGGFIVKTNKSGSWVPFTMNTQMAPFSDPRVRQAFRLIPDRQQMLEQVYGGYGSVGNDVFSPYDPSFPTDLPQRQQDLEQAKSLLKDAGYADLSVKLVTAPAIGGEISMAQVFATQAKGAGVDVQIDQHSVGDFYAQYYLKSAFSQDYGTTQLFLANAGQLMIGADSPYNANAFDDPEYNQLYEQAISTTDNAKRKQLIGQMAKIDYDRGAYIIPIFAPAIEAYSPKVKGLLTDFVTGVTPNNADFLRIWLGD